MRVLHVLEAVGGGTLRHVTDLVTSVPAEHHVAGPAARSSQLSHPDPLGFLRSAGAVVHPLAMSRRPADATTVRAVLRLRRLVREVQPDVVHAHASVAGAVARAATPRPVPVVWTPNGINDVPWITAVERLFRSRMEAMIAVSPSEAELAVRLRLARPEQVRTVMNGIPPHEQVTTRLREEIGIPTDVPVLGFVGRMCEQKDPLTFLEVARRVLAAHPRVHVLCVGSGPLEEEFLGRARRELPQGRFHHVVRDAGAQQLLSAIDVLVSPSRYEGGPYLVLEAALAGTVVVSSDCVGARDYVVHDVSGLVAPIGDAAGLAEHSLRLLTDDAAREALATSARRHVAQVHDLAGMARRTMAVYDELLGQPVAPVLPVQVAAAPVLRRDLLEPQAG